MIQIGFFGKIPLSGDFVVRGVPVTVRQFWDHWMTSHLGFAFVADVAWPEGGVRLSMNGQVGVILPSQDRSGRSFPLLGLVLHDLGEGVDADRWVEAILPALERARAGLLDPVELQGALGEVALGPSSASVDPVNGLTIWTKGSLPVACSGERADAVLAEIFSEV